MSLHELKVRNELEKECMAKVIATLGLRTAVADLCMFGLAACDEGGPCLST